MTCPGCASAMTELALDGHYGRRCEVDTCPQCAGLWFDGHELIQLTAMFDPEGAAAATYLDGMDADVLLGVLFGAPFMMGAFFGVLLLSIALLVKGAGVPRWIPASWLVFILLDFSIGSVGPVDPHWLYLLGAVGLAVHLGRDGGRAWQNA